MPAELDYLDGLKAHYQRSWKTSPWECDLSGGRGRDLPAGFVVLEFAPAVPGMPWIYATGGLGLGTRDVALELHLLAPFRSAECAHVLSAVAHFHHTAVQMDVGHSAYLGMPWIAGSSCDHVLLSHPYHDRDGLAWFSSSHLRRDVRCVWVLPITRAEREFKREHGIDRLEEQFAASGFDYLDPHRDSVV